MKKLLLGILCLSALTLSACGNKGDSSSSSSGDTSSGDHTHSMVFDSFVWTTTPGDYKAKAKYVCSASDGFEEFHDATMSKTTDAPTHTADGANHWKASYDGHEATKDEVLPALGHTWNDVGFCVADGAYNGVTVTVGIDSEAADYAAHTSYFFRALALKGHTYTLPGGVGYITPSETKSYYLNASGAPVEYNKATTPFPASGTFDSYIYFVHTPEMAEPNAKLRVNLKGHDGRVDDFGFCLDHPDEYTGNDMDLNDTIDLDPMGTNDKLFRRVSVNSIHKYSFTIDSPFTADDLSFALKHDETGYSEVDYLSDSSYGFINNLADLSSDNYLYIRVQPVAAREEESYLTIVDEHTLNAAGVCMADGYFDGGDAHTLTLGVDTSSEEAFEKPFIYYYRVRAYAGHTYKMSVVSWQTDHTEFYYIDGGGMCKSITLTDYITEEFPDDSLDNYLYIVYSPQYNSPTTGGHFKITVASHPVDNEHGCCPYGYLGETLEDGVPYGSNFSIPAKDYAYFKALMSNITLDSWNQFEIYWGHNKYNDVTVWYKLNGTWTELVSEDGNVNYGVYDAVTPDDGYIYIQMYNSGESALNVVGAETGINIL